MKTTIQRGFPYTDADCESLIAAIESGSRLFAVHTTCGKTAHSAMRQVFDGKCAACVRLKDRRKFAKATGTTTEAIDTAKARRSAVGAERAALEASSKVIRAAAMWADAEWRVLHADKLAERKRKNGRIASAKHRATNIDTGRETIRQNTAIKRSGPAAPPWLTVRDHADMHARGIAARTLGLPCLDHIVPLKGLDAEGLHVVCGLHVPWNLRGSTSGANMRKSNLFDPEDVHAIRWVSDTLHEVLPAPPRALRISVPSA